MVTAYRLIACLVHLLRESGEKEPWEISQKLLDSLSRVERMEITFGKEKKVWYLNLRPETVKILQKIGYGKIFD